jgi:hypothetical protein
MRLRLLMLNVFVLGYSFALAASDTKVATVDAGIGRCSVEFTVTDTKSQPVYDAKIRVHIAYGFMGMRKLDLEVGTNSDGKAQFTGLPEKPRQPLSFGASQGNREGFATYNPSKKCTEDHSTIVLSERSQEPN